MKKFVCKRLFRFSVLTLICIIITGCSSTPVTYEEKKYTVSATDIDTMTIDVSDRIIELSQSTDDQVHIVYYESENEFYNIELSDSKEFKMVCEYNKAWTDYVGFKSAKKDRTIKIQIPNASINNLNLITSNEDITIPPITLTGSVNIKLNEGNIFLNQLSVGNTARLEAKNGNISGTIVGDYNDFAITSNAKSGKNNLPADKKNGIKNLYVYTYNGDISLEIGE